MACFINFFFHVFWNFINQFLVLNQNFRVHGDEVGYALEARFTADWKLDRYNAFTVFGAQFFNDFVEVGMFSVHFIDENGARQGHFFGIFPCSVRFDFHAGNGGYDYDSRFASHKSRFYLSCEIRISRSVQQVYFITLPLAGCKRCVNRHFALDFFRFVIENGCSVFRLADTIYGTAFKQTIFCD